MERISIIINHVFKYKDIIFKCHDHKTCNLTEIKDFFNISPWFCYVSNSISGQWFMIVSFTIKGIWSNQKYCIQKNFHPIFTLILLLLPPLSVGKVQIELIFRRKRLFKKKKNHLHDLLRHSYVIYPFLWYLNGCFETKQKKTSYISYLRDRHYVLWDFKKYP